MRFFNKLVVVAVSLVIPACIPSLHPLYTDKDTAYDPALVGSWVQDNEDSSWHFAKKENNAYRLIYTDKEGRPGEFEARLVKLDKQMFLDLFPEEPKLPENGYYKFHLLRAHTFMKVSVTGAEMQLAGMDPNWLKSRLESDPDAIRHETMNEMIVFTASPKELQQFVLKHSGDEEAFAAVIHLTRRDVSAE
jgi:hypothetical protein